VDGGDRKPVRGSDALHKIAGAGMIPIGAIDRQIVVVRASHRPTVVPIA
jgi:hypothetical protein